MAQPITADSQFINGAGNTIAIDQPGAVVHDDIKRLSVVEALHHDEYEGKPTDEELSSLRRVAGKIPLSAYFLCFAEFCERGSYYSSIGNQTPVYSHVI